MPIQAAEPRGGQGLVDRRVMFDPRVTFGHRARIGAEFFREQRIDQRSVRGTTAVMEQANNGFDAQCAKPIQALVAPAPVKIVAASVRSHSTGYRSLVIPRLAASSRSCRRCSMTGADDLVVIGIAEPIDRALETGPQFKRHARLPARSPPHQQRRCEESRCAGDE